jgi:hypothetical protein
MKHFPLALLPVPTLLHIALQHPAYARQLSNLIVRCSITASLTAVIFWRPQIDVTESKEK